mmetsp:Transcript_29902/g.79600  ORF Transcript_29902/g.79600 Transcript_29902/m.79600 type:complete len:97 (+) Transcript_29902:141-431(+)
MKLTIQRTGPGNERLRGEQDGRPLHRRCAQPIIVRPWTKNLREAVRPGPLELAFGAVAQKLVGACELAALMPTGLGARECDAHPPPGMVTSGLELP